MSDSAIQGYYQDLIQADSNFANDDVTLGDYLILSGAGAPFAVILPGRIVSAARSGDWGQVQVVWEHTIEVFERFVNDDYSDFTTARQAVLDVIGENPTLGGHSEISSAYVREATEPRYLYMQGTTERPSYVFSRLTARSTEEVSHAGSGEFA